MNYLSLKELDTLKQQGYDLASVQKGIALALGAKPAEQVCALMKASGKDTISKKTEKENIMNTKPDATTLTAADLQYLKMLLKDELRLLETEIQFAGIEIQGIKQLRCLYPNIKESCDNAIKSLREDLKFYRKKRNKVAKIQTKLKRIKVRDSITAD